MGHDDAGRRGTGEWKQKYYDSLSELERKEQQWSEAEAMLRQGLSRLTLAAEPGLPQLESQLDELRDALRRGRDSLALRGLLDELSTTILALDQRRRETSSLPGPAEALVQLVDAVVWPRGMNHKARALKKQFNTRDADVEHLIQGVSGLVGEALERVKGPPEDATAGRHRGLLAGLFGGGEDNSDASPATAKPVGTVAPSSAGETTGVPNSPAAAVEPPPAPPVAEARPTPVSLADADATEVEVARIGDLLVELLDRVGLPVELETRAQAVRHRLMDEPDLGVLDHAVVEIAGLIAEARASAETEKRELEIFLKQLTLRLQELDAAFQENTALNEASRADGRDLDAAVQAEVRGIQSSVQSAQHLEALKHDIQRRLEHIDRHLGQFRSAEVARQREAQAQVEALTAKLETMENEAVGLRERVREKHRLATHDPLTGLANRIAYQERVEQEIARSKRYGSPLVIMMWDVDRFKAVNDLYGHQAGDRVLVVIAKRLSESVRESDFIARYGGEEFVVLMPEIDLDGARQAAEKLRQAVASCDFHYHDKAVPITVSCGLTLYRVDEDITDCFERADAALYRAKDQGRNRVEVAQ